MIKGFTPNKQHRVTGNGYDRGLAGNKKIGVYISNISIKKFSRRTCILAVTRYQTEKTQHNLSFCNRGDA